MTNSSGAYVKSVTLGEPLPKQCPLSAADIRLALARVPWGVRLSVDGLALTLCNLPVKSENDDANEDENYHSEESLCSGSALYL